MKEIILNDSESSIDNERVEDQAVKPKYCLYIQYFMISFLILSIICLLLLVVFFFISTIILWILFSLTVIFLILLIISIIIFGIQINKLKEEEIRRKKQEVKEMNQEDMSNKLIKDLEESKINFINIGGQSCYQSSYLQGFIHVLLPLAIKRLNEKREIKITNLDELKNDNEFNNAFLDTTKEVIHIQRSGGKDKNGNMRVKAEKIYNLEKKKILNVTDNKHYDHEGLDCLELVHKANENLILNGYKVTEKSQRTKKSSTKTKKIEDKVLINIIKSTEPSIFSELMKIKIDNEYVYNIVLKFDKKTLNNQNLTIFDLLAEHFKNNKRKINEASDIIYMIVDRISSGENIKKNFIISEKIYLSHGYFEEISTLNSTLYELKFIIFHNFSSNYSGHYTSYSNIKGKWFYFNDINGNNANQENPPLSDFSENFFPICFYYVKLK